MSSIYKKGRDGYYYYQTYVFNSKSNKMDKRIFHSLGTKDLDEAKKKQFDLDLQYEKIKKAAEKDQKFQFSSKYKLLAFFIILSFTLFYFEKINYNYVEESNLSANTNETISLNAFEDSSSQELSTESGSKVQGSANIINDKIEKEQNTIENFFPNFEIQRIERLPDAFDQGKIYVTVNKNSSKESQKMLCDSLVKSFNEFSNIVICIYSNDSVGKKLANGRDKSLSNIEKKQAWLSFYTYNKVEGEFFDTSPGDFLGI